jgi:hypothetical protein
VEQLISSLARKPELEPYMDSFIDISSEVRAKARDHFESGDFRGYLLYESELIRKAASGRSLLRLKPICGREEAQHAMDNWASFYGLSLPLLDHSQEKRLNRILVALLGSMTFKYLVS